MPTIIGGNARYNQGTGFIGRMTTKLHPKLAARYYGPYLVLKQIGAVAFKLQLPEQSRIHPVFHMSQLKKAVGTKLVEAVLPDELQEEAVVYEPQSILGDRVITQYGEQVAQVLVHWKGKSPEEATWEEVSTLTSHFPDSNLEDKVSFEGGGIVRHE